MTVREQRFPGSAPHFRRVGGQRLACTLCALLAMLERTGFAQPPEAGPVDARRTEAVELYREGARLLAAGKYEDAADQFQRSLRLLRGRGTLLNLAICHENMGELPTAWREFSEVRSEAEQTGDTARSDAAQEHLAWLEPQLSFVSITVPGPPISGLAVELDGVPIADLDTPQPVAGGRHRLRAFAPGRVEWTTDVWVTRTQERIPVKVPVLQQLPSPAEVAAPPDSARVSAPQLPAAARRFPTEKPDWSPVYISGAATAVFASGLLASSILYYERRNEYYRATSKIERVPSEEEQARRSSVTRMDWINRTFVATTAVSAGVTGFFVYRALASKTAARPSAWATPWVSGDGAGVEGVVRY